MRKDNPYWATMHDAKWHFGYSLVIEKQFVPVGIDRLSDQQKCCVQHGESTIHLSRSGDDLCSTELSFD